MSNGIGTGPEGTAVIVDTAGNLPGRGAWLHPDPECAHAAIRRRAFARALRITSPPDTSAVVEYVGSVPGADEPDPPRQQNRQRRT
ncbi:DUF448 domain-containing protein [Mycolicibacterium mengxianglii]|uniref:DUF448 domain-containing protein n=1 Tax=Mycolicibacterium mengxianglii TaxID=2736649 RepID=UPI001E378C34|nr:YlxR family protein [Mycolicibacterium mengxianglii]